MSRACVTLLADVEPQPVEWLWPSYIPLGMLTVFDGDPGLGKSTLLADITARLSRGNRMPDGSPGPKSSGTVILSAEDDWARVIRPRLDAAGVDHNKVAFVRVQETEGPRELAITAEDMSALEEAIQWIGARLVTIDPVMAYLPDDVNSNRDQDVRRTLTRLRDLAERTGVAIVVVRHLNKTPGGSPLYRGGGSIGFIAAARSGLLLAPDPDSPESGRVLAVEKSNLARIPASLRLQLVQEEGHAFPHVAWGAPCDLTATRLLAAGGAPPRRPARVVARDLLLEALADGSVPVKDIATWADEAGISWKTVQRAGTELGVITEKAGQPSHSDQHWAWSLPQRVANGTLDGTAKAVSTRDDDHLRDLECASQSEIITSPKEVNLGADDHLREPEVVDLADANASLQVVDLAALPLRIEDSTDPAPSPKEVKSAVADHLRVSVCDERVNTIASLEGGQAPGNDRLRWLEELATSVDWTDEPWEAGT